MQDILSYERSLELKEAGIVVESKYYYDIQEKELYLKPLISGYIKLSTCEFINNRNMPNDLIPAPTFLGLWRMMPMEIEGYYKNLTNYCITYEADEAGEYGDRDEIYRTIIQDNNISEAAAEMLLRLKEEGVI